LPRKTKGTSERISLCSIAGIASAAAKRRRRDEPGADHARLFSRVTGDIEGCWNFTGHKTADGYGKVNYRGKSMLAHRVSYLIVNGRLPADLLVCHRCDNPSCINPSHLFLGTDFDNTMDAIKKGRRILIHRKPKHEHDNIR